MLREVEVICRKIPHKDLCILWDGRWRLRNPFADLHTEIMARLARLSAAVPGDVELGLHLCYGDRDAKYFRPLRGLKLGSDTELYLGLVHADGVEATKRRIEAASPFAPEFGIATEWGMARCRTPELVRTLLNIHAEVSSEPAAWA